MKTTVRLRVVPNARRSEVVGLHGEAIKVKVQAPALEGKANAALREFLAETLDLSIGDVELVAGEKSRDKVFAISGLDLAEIHRRLLPP